MIEGMVTGRNKTTQESAILTLINDEMCKKNMQCQNQWFTAQAEVPLHAGGSIHTWRMMQL